MCMTKDSIELMRLTGNDLLIPCPTCGSCETGWSVQGSLRCRNCKTIWRGIKKNDPTTWYPSGRRDNDELKEEVAKKLESGKITPSSARALFGYSPAPIMTQEELDTCRYAFGYPPFPIPVKVEEKDGGVVITRKVDQEIHDAIVEMQEKDHSLFALKDSGARREFETGAVRDISEGKGRCDLLPLDVVGQLLGSKELYQIEAFKESKNDSHLFTAIKIFSGSSRKEICRIMLEVSNHFEAGAEKYGENNWKKGIPLHCYIDSAVRHYLKHLRGDTDEPHDRAFVWNILCAIWTFEHKPELDDIEKDLSFDSEKIRKWLDPIIDFDSCKNGISGDCGGVLCKGKDCDFYESPDEDKL